MTPTRWFALGCVLAGAGIALGAFGAHGLRSRIPAERLAVYETGVRYHLVHALALLAVAWSAERLPARPTEAAGWLFTAGVLVFSGSLYALAISGIRWLGAITPIGGVCFLSGWAILAWTAFRAR